MKQAPKKNFRYHRIYEIYTLIFNFVVVGSMKVCLSKPVRSAFWIDKLTQKDCQSFSGVSFIGLIKISHLSIFKAKKFNIQLEVEIRWKKSFFGKRLVDILWALPNINMHSSALSLIWKIILNCVYISIQINTVCLNQKKLCYIAEKI